MPKSIIQEGDITGMEYSTIQPRKQELASILSVVERFDERTSG